MLTEGAICVGGSGVGTQGQHRHREAHGSVGVAGRWVGFGTTMRCRVKRANRPSAGCMPERLVAKWLEATGLACS